MKVITLISLIVLFFQPMAIHNYLKSIFFNAPIEKKEAELLNFFKNDSSLLFSTEEGRFSVIDQYGSQRKSISKRFTFVQHPIFPYKTESSVITLSYIVKGTVEIFQGLNICFDFKRKQDAQLMYQNLISRLSGLGANIVFSNDHNINLQEGNFSYNFEHKPVHVNIAVGEFFQSKRGLYYTQIEINNF